MYMRDLILAHIYLLGFVVFKPGVTVWNRASALPLASTKDPMQVIAFRTTKEPRLSHCLQAVNKVKSTRQ